MCGICGYIDFSCNTNDDVLDKMIESLKHRGPDDSGKAIFKSDDAIIGLGHARLSIIDLSENGRQPMHYENLSIIFNGEIYNYSEIKSKLIDLGHKFVTTSDTEVILHSIHEWGVKAVDMFIGMFAIAIIDHENRNLTVIRDRAGVKPVFYYWKDGLFMISSELKAFHQHPSFKPDIDYDSVVQFFDFGFVPAPYSIFKNCHKLLPGHILSLKFSPSELNITQYWNVDDYYKKNKLNISFEDAKSQLTTLLKSACDYRMVADVPVGVFLSGGYDSSLVTAMLQKNRTSKINTFTIAMEDGKNEAPFARKIAEYLSTNHTEYVCSVQEAQNIIPTLPFFYDEPFADSSAIPTTLVSRLARKSVTVALSADAGDETFTGYPRYISLHSKLNFLNRIPSALHFPIKKTLNVASRIIPDKSFNINHRLQGLSQGLNKNKLIQAQTVFRLMNTMPENLKKKIFSGAYNYKNTSFDFDTDNFKNENEIALAADYKMYLQNDILQKVDRATMSVSLEGREPLLDHRIIEVAAQLPYEFKFSNQYGGKRILKDIVHSLIPREIMERPKSGFSIPITLWLRTDLSYLIDEFLSETALKQSGFFNVSFVLEQVKLFRNNKLYYSTFIWKILMFQMWYFKWISK